MTAFGTLADRNRVQAATLDNGGWSETMPIRQAQALPLGLRARSLAAGTDAAPVVIQGRFDKRRPVTFAALIDTNMRQAERVRLRLWSDDQHDPANTSTLVFDSRDPALLLDRKVVPSLWTWRDLRWGDANLLRGDMDPEDYALWPTNVHIRVPLTRAMSFRWDLYGSGYVRGTGATANMLEAGLVWLSDSLRFRVNYDWNGVDGYNPTDEVTRTAGGGVWIEPGIGYRSAEIPWDWLRDQEGNKLFDLSRRINFSEPVVWMPSDDPAECFCYGFIGRNAAALKLTRRYVQRHSATLQLEEITR